MKKTFINILLIFTSSICMAQKQDSKIKEVTARLTTPVNSAKLCRIGGFESFTDVDGDGVPGTSTFIPLPSNLIFLNNCGSQGVLDFIHNYFIAHPNTFESGSDCDDNDASISTFIVPTVSLATSPTSFCAGLNASVNVDQQTFQGLSPQYNFFVNDSLIQSGSSPSFSVASLPVGMFTIGCVLISSLTTTCLSQQSVTTSSSIQVKPTLIPSVSITTQQSIITQGDTAFFTATSTNGGFAPIYDFRVNGISKQSSSSNKFSSNTMLTNDVVSCIMTANNICQTTTTIQSNRITITVLQAGCPNASVITGAASVCKGSAVQYFSSNAGGVWSSSIAAATINPTTGVLTINGNGGSTTIKYLLTIGGCVLNATKTVTLNPIPAIPSIAFAAGTVNPQTGSGGGSNFCNNKTFTLVGNPTGGVWSAIGAAINVNASTGVVSTVALGSATLKYTVSTTFNCTNNRSITGTIVGCAARAMPSSVQQVANSEFIVYPNPAHSVVSLQIETLVGAGSIVIIDVYGKQAKKQSLSMGTNTIDISKFSKGIYFINMTTNEGKSIKKLIVE